MKIHTVIVGSLEENCYILEKENKVLVIDPGDEIEKIKKVIGSKEVLGVLITHNHFDHVGALSYFNKKNIYSFNNLEEKEYEIGPFKFKCIYTPGHSKDSVTFYFEEENVMFVGDFIFKESIGRTDLPGANPSEMKESIKKILTYDENIKLYPGHDEDTTLKYEKENNPYLK